MLLEKKVAIVTGGARGIGQAVARRFLVEGARVVLADVDDEAADAAAAELKPLGEVVAVACDVGERLDIRNLIAETIDAFGRIDVLVNNAGIVFGASFLELEEEDFDRVLRVNLKGSFLVAQAVARQMVEQIEAGGPPGAIVNMSSINAVLALPDQVPYSISKGGINQLTKVAALALAPYGIRVNAVGPGSVMTEMLEKVVHEDDARDRILSRTPLGRIGAPAEIAAVVAFLASDQASYMTGQTVYADGGRLPLAYTVAVDD